uniref:p14 n=1 Tax=Little cherry virus 2 TaxID=154339 RepID=A0A679G5F0_9CLOS|nr:p14 [Little cherry virus 2]
MKTCVSSKNIFIFSSLFSHAQILSSTYSFHRFILSLIQLLSVLSRV